MPKYVLVRCPYCSYVWRSRLVDAEEVENDPEEALKRAIVCPRNKERFDSDWSRKPKLWVEPAQNYAELRKKLRKLNSE